MRRLLWLLVLLVFSSIHISAQNDDSNAGMCPVTPKLGDKPIRRYWLAGTVGRRPVRAYMERDGNVSIAAFYYTDSTWTPVLLGGSWSNGLVEVSEKAIDPDDAGHTGRLSGHLTSAGFSGSWNPSGDAPSFPVRLHLTPRLSCNGSGPWKPLDDPRLPVTFSYPASWQIGKYQHGFGPHEDNFTLTCPDPSAMFYEEGLNVVTGTLKDIADRGFHLANGKWFDDQSSGCMESSGCAAPTTQHGIITVLDGDDTEWRISCARHGYVAQGDGHDRMLILGDRWVELFGEGDDGKIALRIAATAEPRNSQ